MEKVKFGMGIEGQGKEQTKRCLHCKEELIGEIIQNSSCDSPLQRCKKCKHVMVYWGMMRDKLGDLGNIKLLNRK